VQTDVALGGGTGPEHYGGQWDNRRPMDGRDGDSF